MRRWGLRGLARSLSFDQKKSGGKSPTIPRLVVTCPHPTQPRPPGRRNVSLPIFHFVSAVGKNATDRAVAPADWLVRRLDFDSNKDNRKFVPFLWGSFMPVDFRDERTIIHRSRRFRRFILERSATTSFGKKSA